MSVGRVIEVDRIRREAHDDRRAVVDGRAASAEARPIHDAVRAWSQEVVGDVGRDGDEIAELTEASAAMVAQAVAVRIHLAAVVALHEPPGGTPPDVVSPELALHTSLGALRAAAQHGSIEQVGVALSYLSGAALDRLREACAAADPAAADPIAGHDAVAVSQLARRLAAAAAGGVLLQYRLSSSRLQSSTVGIAERRTHLVDHDGPFIADTVMSLADLDEGQRTGLLVNVVDAAWIERPERPYTQLVLANGEELRVHFKNARQVGHTGPQWLWARCKAEGSDGDVPYAVAEFEGPTGGAATVWENWLQTEARQAYDIAPSSIHAFAAFGAPGSLSCRLDITSRINREEAA